MIVVSLTCCWLSILHWFRYLASWDAVFIVVTVIVTGLVFFARLLVIGCSMHKGLLSQPKLLQNGMRIGYIRNVCEEVKAGVVEMVQRIFECRADRCDESVKVEIMVPLFKKGDRTDRNKYRGVCLLAMCSRVLGRVLAKRLA